MAAVPVRALIAKNPTLQQGGFSNEEVPMAARTQTYPSLVIVLVLIVLLVAPTAAMAGGSPRAHDGGFFLRLSAGGGSTSTSIDNVFVLSSGPGTLKFSGGPTGDINVAIGGIVANNLALHGTLFGWSVSDPDAEFQGDTGQAQGNIGMNAYGGGLTYYFMPVNIYVSGSVGAALLSFEDESTDTGFAFDLTLGKEWWVGEKWGLGVAVGLNYHSVPDANVDEKWSGTSFAIRFTATMN